MENTLAERILLRARSTLPRDTGSAVPVLACAWPALLLATMCLLPFLNKAYLTDDPWFLMIGQQIVKQPMHPMDFDICWNNGFPHECRNAYQWASGNALMGQVALGYVLVPTVLGGTHEWTAHLTQLVLAWIAVLAMTALILRFGWDRWHATAGALLLVAIPPFLPMASTAMPDILATALAVIAMEQLAAWKTERRWRQGAAAAIALGLAGFARPHLVLLLPLGAFFLLDTVNPRKFLIQFRRSPWLWIPVVAGIGLLLAAFLALRSQDLGPKSLSFDLRRRNILANLYAFLLYFALPLPLALCWAANRLKAGRWLLIAIFIAVGAMLPMMFTLQWDRWLVMFLAMVGFGVLGNLLYMAARERDVTGLFLMLWALIPLPIVSYEHLPIKYLLPCIPAVILLCFRLLEGVPVRLARAVVVLLIVAETGYSIVILRSDAEYADSGRDAMHALVTPHVAAGESVWFPQQCCSYWYAALDGARLADPRGPLPLPGDLLVVDPTAAGSFPQLGRFPRRHLVETRTHKYRFGRTVGLPFGGLYGGFWLWGFGDTDTDQFELWRIE
jgi:hypothetical protein